MTGILNAIRLRQISIQCVTVAVIALMMSASISINIANVYAAEIDTETNIEVNEALGGSDLDVLPEINEEGILSDFYIPVEIENEKNDAANTGSQEESSEDVESAPAIETDLFSESQVIEESVAEESFEETVQEEAKISSEDGDENGEDDDENEDFQFEFKENEVTAVIGQDDYYISLPMLTTNYIQSCFSSDEQVVKAEANWDYIELEIIGVGTSTITAYDYEGNVATCNVTIEAPDLILDEKDLTVSVSEEYAYIDIKSGYGISCVSSDESVVKVYVEEYIDEDSICLELLKPGKAVITVTDCARKTEKINVTVSDADWSLIKTNINCYLSDEYDYLFISSNDYSLSLKWTTSNAKVVKVNGDDECCELEILGVGTATITATDNFGKKEECKVTVSPDQISFGSDSVLKFYDYVNDSIDTDFYLSTDGDNYIVSVKSSNEKVAKVKRVKYSESGYVDYYMTLTPVGAGKAEITATDQYGQTAKMKVTVTQKYIDYSKYYDDLSESYIYSSNVYGIRSLTCCCPISANVYTTIGSKKYTGTVDEDGDYIIKGLPILNAGKKITVYFQKGQAKYSETVTIKPKYGGSLKASINTQTYSGNPLSPAITITDGKTKLKKGTDFTVKYSNNKNVGSGKATVSFIGNYKGAKAVSFKIIPKGTNISKLIAGIKAFTVTWKKQAVQTTGYQIQYNTNKNFTSGNKIKTVSKTATLKLKVNGLIKGKTYFVRTRTYKKVGNITYYSKWSTAKSIKITK